MGPDPNASIPDSTSYLNKIPSISDTKLNESLKNDIKKLKSENGKILDETTRFERENAQLEEQLNAMVEQLRRSNGPAGEAFTLPNLRTVKDRKNVSGRQGAQDEALRYLNHARS